MRANESGGEVFYSSDDVCKRGNQAKVDTVTVCIAGKKREMTTGCHMLAKKDEASQTNAFVHVTNLLSAVLPEGENIDWDDFTAFMGDREGAQMAAAKNVVGDDRFFGCHAHLCLKSEKLVAEVLQNEEVKAVTAGTSLYPINTYTKSSSTKTVTILHAFRKLLSPNFSNLTYNVSGDVTHDIKILSAGGDRFGATSVNSCLILEQREVIDSYLETITRTGIVETVSSYCLTPWFWICLALYAITGYEFTIHLMKKLNLKIDNKILTKFFGDERYVYDKEAKADSYNAITEWMKEFSSGDFKFKGFCQIVYFIHSKTFMHIFET